MLDEWNDTGAPIHAGCLHEFVEAQVERCPEATAVVCRDMSSTYGELNARANRLAHYLVGRGAGPGSLVGLCVDRGLDMVAGMLGILKTGAAYVPIDALLYPPERIAFILEDAHVKMAVTQQALVGQLGSTVAEIVCLDDAAQASAIDACPSGNPQAQVAPDDLAYVIYTSGSTGVPKGVMVEHRGVANVVAAVREVVDPQPGDRILQLAPMSFDMSIGDVLLSLCFGASLHVGSVDSMLSGEALAEQLRSERITHATVAASVLGRIPEGVDLPDLSTILVGAEACPAATVARWAPGRRFFNTYGPTETTIVTTYAQCVADGTPGDPPIGRPLPNTRVYVVDEDMNQVPVEAPGELCIAGAGVARGYLGLPELTEERFVPDPFGRPGERLYRTGDRARWRRDGNLEFLGRIDHQVQLRGFRVELGEIETALRRHDHIREAAVITREGQPGDTRLVAYVAADPPAPSVTELRAHLSRTLPSYMVPNVFVLLDRLPLTPNQKIDRRNLPTPTSDRPALQVDYVAPRTVTEQAIADAWSHILGIDQIGIHDDFFELGGDSLLALRVVAHTAAAGVATTLRALFETPTVATLALAAEQSAAEAELHPIARVDRSGGGPFPLSSAQERMWVLNQLEPDSPSYNISAAVRVHGPFDVDAFQRALDEVVGRHESLRTRFVTTDDGPGQVIDPPASVALRVVDVADLADAERLAAEDARAPFDLARGPLLRVAALRLGPDDHVVSFTVHHIVADGWSLGIVARELLELHLAFRTGVPSALPEPALQYLDHALWQREWLAGGVLESQLAFWRERLADLPMLELPTDRARPVVQGFRGDRVGVRLGRDVLEDLRGVVRGESATVFMGLLAAFAALLRRYSGQDDVVVGSPVAGRSRAEAESLVGLFVNTLALRVDVSGDPTFRELLGRVRELTLDALAHQDVPLEQLVGDLRLPRDPGRSPLFQVLLMLQNVPSVDVLTGSSPAAGGLQLSQLVPDQGSSMLDLALAVVESPEGVEGVVEFDTDLFDRETIEGFVEHLEVLLGSAVVEPDRPLSQLQMLGDKERRLLLEEWNDTAAPIPSACLHELIEAQVRTSPEATAVVCEGVSLSYAELNERANRLAHWLAGRGMEPGCLVGLCVDRSPDMVVGLLGILKAGAAYVPIDALLYPPERIALVLDDAQVELVVSQTALLAHVAGADVEVVCLDHPEQAATIAACPAHDPTSGVTPDDLAYVIYTSGSTGTPKGVMVEHRGLANLVGAIPGVEGDTPSDELRFLQFAPVSFDISIGDILLSLSVGASLYIAPVESLLSGEALAEQLRRDRITHLSAAASVLARIPEHYELPDLTSVAVGAEVCPAETVARWAPGRRFFNAYGATETTIVATYVECEAAGPQDPPIGRPIPNTRVYVLDQEMNLVPIGMPGELCVAGAGVARGYLRRSDLTQERFVADPFGEPGGRLYRTGDRARWRRDGTLEFLGRLDNQVQLRGFRVELGEIEAALRRHHQVRDAAVTAPENDDGDLRLVAYVATDPPGPTVTDLRSHLGRTLPYYMVPNAFVMLDDLPLTPSGKIDRTKLPAPSADRPALQAGYVAPRTATEQVVADAWSHVLGIDQIGVHDNFFELGGDSLLALRVVARAAEAGVHVNLRMMLENQTVEGLAGTAGQARVVVADQGPATGPVELTPIQRWYFSLGEPYHHGNMAGLLRVPPDVLDAEHLRATFRALAEHHDVLRMRYRQVGDRWVQSYGGLAEADVPVHTIDLTGVPRSEHRSAIESACAELQASLDLADGPVVRVALMDLGDEARLFVVIHHLVVDVVSLHILLEDLQSAYRSVVAGEAVVLPPKTSSFQQWADRVRDLATAEALANEADFWAAQRPSRPMPVDFPDGRNTGGSELTVVRHLPAGTTAALLHEVHTAYGTQAKHLLLTALAQVLRTWSPDVLVWLESHGRDEGIGGDLDLSRTFGWFSSIFPIRFRLGDGLGDGEAIESVKAQLDAVPGLGVGFGALQSYGPADVVSRLPAPTDLGINFNYIGRFDTVLGPGSPMTLADESPGPMFGPRALRPSAIYVNADVFGETLSCEWIYSRNLHRPSTIEGLADAFMDRLQALVRHCLETAQR
ncbi:MAG: amino acid adenylation domain-containing protein [Acidimicrobiales bacterium]